jgi:hypothetical protein
LLVVGSQFQYGVYEMHKKMVSLLQAKGGTGEEYITDSDSEEENDY